MDLSARHHGLRFEFVISHIDKESKKLTCFVRIGMCHVIYFGIRENLVCGGELWKFYLSSFEVTFKAKSELSV